MIFKIIFIFNKIYRNKRMEVAKMAPFPLIHLKAKLKIVKTANKFLTIQTQRKINIRNGREYNILNI